MKLKPCKKHERQEPLGIQETIRESGDHVFQVKCLVCGKLGERRNTKYGAQRAWNEDK